MWRSFNGTFSLGILFFFCGTVCSSVVCVWCDEDDVAVATAVGLPLAIMMALLWCDLLSNLSGCAVDFYISYTIHEYVCISSHNGIILIVCLQANGCVCVYQVWVWFHCIYGMGNNHYTVSYTQIHFNKVLLFTSDHFLTMTWQALLIIRQSDRQLRRGDHGSLGQSCFMHRILIWTQQHRAKMNAMVETNECMSEVPNSHRFTHCGNVADWNGVCVGDHDNPQPHACTDSNITFR